MISYKVQKSDLAQKCCDSLKENYTKERLHQIRDWGLVLRESEGGGGIKIGHKVQVKDGGGGDIKSSLNTYNKRGQTPHI